VVLVGRDHVSAPVPHRTLPPVTPVTSISPSDTDAVTNAGGVSHRALQAAVITVSTTGAIGAVVAASTTIVRSEQSVTGEITFTPFMGRAPSPSPATTLTTGTTATPTLR
jgi:hypothetical protein